ncbi:MAG: pentapeptide repeat-containing protein [Cyanobacteria bacterium P01_C01_bin.72]
MVRNWQVMLCRLIEVMIQNTGLPMEKIDPRPSFAEEIAQSRNARESLLAVLNACARTTKKVSEINWHSPEIFGSWVASLQPQRVGGQNTLGFRCFSWLNLDKQVLLLRDFYGANFQNSRMRGTQLSIAILFGANLEGANFRRANLTRANLTDTDLREADFREADLTGADLKGTVLEGKNIAEITKREEES